MVRNQAQKDIGDRATRFPHATDQPLLRQYLQGLRDDSRLVKISERYTSLKVRTEAYKHPKDALEAAQELDRAVVHSHLGAGKSTLLQCLAHRCAEETLSSTRQALVPFLLDLSLLQNGKGLDGLLLDAFGRYQPAASRATLKASLGQQTPFLLLDNLDSGPSEGNSSGKSESEATRMIIERFEFSGGQVKASTALKPGETVDIDLPPIEMSGIGTAEGGVTADVAATQISKKLVKTVIREAAKNSLNKVIEKKTKGLLDKIKGNN